MKNMIALLYVLAPTLAFAAEGGHGEAHGEGGIPMAVTWQFVNFALFAILMFVVLRKPTKHYFMNREASFKAALKKAEAAKLEAEAKMREMEARLAKLQSTSNESIAQAKADAETLKAKIIQEAAELSQRLRDEARRSAEVEINRAKDELREELLAQSVVLAQKVLTDKMADQDQKRLQTEFVDKIQVVR